MKIIYVIVVSFLFSFYNLKSQVSDFRILNITTGTALVNNNDNFYRSTTALTSIAHNFEIKNISNTALTLTVRKYDDVINTISAFDLAESSFCTGANCYPSGINSATIVLGSNETLNFKADLDEASVAGESAVRYKFTNSANSSDVLSFSMKYNNPLSVKSDEAVITSEINIYPNPSSSNFYLNVNSYQFIDDVNLQICNYLGDIVLSKNIFIRNGLNTIPFNTDNLSSGIYYIKTNQKGINITKKIIITKN
jgi:hypothetical protein